MDTVPRGATFEEARPIELKGEEASHESDDVLIELLAVTPTTIAGCVTLHRYVEELTKRYTVDGCGGVFELWRPDVQEAGLDLLSRVATALERAV